MQALVNCFKLRNICYILLYINLLNAKRLKMMRPERLELPIFRSGGERVTNCAKAPW